MKRSLVSIVAGLPLVIAASLQAAPDKSVAAGVYEKASASLVAVQYVWENEAGRREITAVGVVVGEGGLVMVPMLVIPPQFIPDAQAKEFKIIVPKVETDHEELEATFIGRDERNQVAFIKLKDASKALPAIKFSEGTWNVGDPVYSVGMLPKASGYKTYLRTGMVGAKLRGETPVQMVTGELAASGGLVFNGAGELTGYVLPHEGAFFWLEPRGGRQEADNPHYFVSASEILPALAAPPADAKALKPLPFTGIAAMNGLSKDLAEVFDLTGKPAVEIGDVIPGTPAAAAGLEKGWIITEFDGKPLERGDEPEELGGILGRKLVKKNVGDKITFTVIAKRGDTPRKVELTLVERPEQPNTQPRFYAEELGFSVRNGVLGDYYRRKMIDPTGKPTSPGVVVAFIKPNSSAQSGRLAQEDLVTQLNGQPIKTTEEFKAAYEAFRKEKPKEAIVLQVFREGSTQVIRIEPPQ